MMDEKIVRLGRRIKVMRIEKGIMQTELAERIGLSQTNMSNIESGRTAATVANLFKISEVLKCKMADFFAEFDSETKAEKAKEFSVEELQEAAKLLQMLRNTKS